MAEPIVTTDENVDKKDLEVKSTEKKEEIMIPKTRFDEVNNQLKDLKKFKDDYELKQSEIEKQKAFESGKVEEFYKTELAKKDEMLKQKELEVIETKKDKLITEYGIHETFKKFVVGSTVEELKESAENLAKELEANGLKNKKEDLTKKLDPKFTEKDKNKNGVLTREDISKMSNEEYNKRRSEILELLKEHKI